MEITFSNIKASVKKHLSIIGKRLYDKEGRNMFSNITVSTLEDPVFEEYISEAAQKVEAFLRQLLSTYSVSSTAINLTLVNTRGNGDFDARCGDMIERFIISYTLAEYLSMTHPDLSKKYEESANNTMSSLIVYAFHKNPPSIN